MKMKKGTNAPPKTETANAITGTDDLIKTATSQLTRLLDQSFSNLKSVATFKEDGKPRLFFPSGIELIFVKLTVGLPEKPVVAVEVKIAGEKGIKAIGPDSAAGVEEQVPTTG